MRKKLSGFQQPRKLVVKDLIRKLTQQDQKNISKSIDRILNSRKKKLRQIRKLQYSQINQQAFKPSKSIQVFSEEAPIETGNPFLNQKYRRNIIAPNKAFNSQPNSKQINNIVKGGQIDQKMLQNYYSTEDKRVRSKQFEEYVRIIKQQTGSQKRKSLEKSEKKLSVPVKMKKTFFKKYPSDRFNFYQPPIKQITRIFDLTSLNDQKKFTQSRKLSQKYSTIDTSKISTLNSQRNALVRFNSQGMQY